MRLLVGLFYRRIDVVGVENLPRQGGLVVAANHHNSVVDAMILIAELPRRLRMLANAPLFRNPLVGPFLKLLGALPVQRRQEAGNDPARNTALFAATTETLTGGGAIAIFPEGRTQPEPVLLELRTGAARMLLAAEEGRDVPSVSLVPVGLLFSSPGTFREGQALILIGAPLETAHAVQRARSEPEAAARHLTDDLATAIRALIVEADDRETLRTVGLIESLWRDEGGAVPEDAGGRVVWLQRAMRTYRRLLERAPERVAELRRRLVELVAEGERTGLGAGPPASTPALAGRVAWLLARLVLLSPLAVVGLILNVVPYRLTGFIVRKARRTDEEEATDKIGLGLLLFPATWLAELLLALRFTGPWGALAFLVALVPTSLLALAWSEDLERLRRESRALIHCLRDPGLPVRLRDRRRGLATELRALAALVPEEWPE